MNKRNQLLSASLLALALFACQPDKKGPGPEAPAKPQPGMYAIYEDHSQLVVTLFPEASGAAVTARITMAGTLSAKDRQLKGGEASLWLSAMTVEEFGSPSASSEVRARVMGMDMFGATEDGSGNVEILKLTPVTASKSGETHIASLRFTLGKKKTTQEIPVMLTINEQHIALITAGPQTMDLSKWGMRPGAAGWKNEGLVEFRLRGDSNPPQPQAE